MAQNDHTIGGRLEDRAQLIRFDAMGFAVDGVDNNGRADFFGPRGDTTWNRQRLEAHLASLSEIQRRLELTSGTCDAVPAFPGESDDLLLKTEIMKGAIGAGCCE